MPQPTLRDLHIDAALSNMSVSLLTNPTDYVSTRVFPTLAVDNKSDKYWVYDRSDWLRDEAKKRTGNTESVGSGYRQSTDSYEAEIWAFHKDIDDYLRLNADSNFNLDRDAVSFVTRKLLLRMEREWVTTFFGPTIWGTDMTGVASGENNTSTFRQWNDVASNPIADIQRAARIPLSITGLHANTLVIGYDVYMALQNHPDIIDRYKYTTASVITSDLLAPLLGVQRIIVADSIYNASEEGVANPTYQFLLGKHALLVHVTPNPGIMAATAGYTFLWRGISAAGQPVLVRRFPMTHLRSERIEAECAYDMKVVARELGVFLQNVVA